MGDVLNRGSKDRPRWYCRYVDTDGKRKQRATHQPNKKDALRFLGQIEERIAQGKVGIVEPTPAELERTTVTVRELVARFLGDVEDVPGYAPPRIKSIERYRRDAHSLQ